MIWWKEQRVRWWRQHCCTKLHATREGKKPLTVADTMWQQWRQKPSTGHSMQILLPGKLHGFGKCILFKSEQMFDERLELHIHTASDTLQGTHLLGSPDYSSYHLLWGGTHDLQVRSLTTGLLSGLKVLKFSLFTLPLNGEYAKKGITTYILCS